MPPRLWPHRERGGGGGLRDRCAQPGDAERAYAPYCRSCSARTRCPQPRSGWTGRRANRCNTATLMAHMASMVAPADTIPHLPASVARQCSVVEAPGPHRAPAPSKAAVHLRCRNRHPVRQLIAGIGHKATTHGGTVGGHRGRPRVSACAPPAAACGKSVHQVVVLAVASPTRSTSTAKYMSLRQ